jgi:hypothetical protein
VEECLGAGVVVAKECAVGEVEQGDIVRLQHRGLGGLPAGATGQVERTLVALVGRIGRAGVPQDPAPQVGADRLDPCAGRSCSRHGGLHLVACLERGADPTELSERHRAGEVHVHRSPRMREVVGIGDRPLEGGERGMRLARVVQQLGLPHLRHSPDGGRPDGRLGEQPPGLGQVALAVLDAPGQGEQRRAPGRVGPGVLDPGPGDGQRLVEPALVVGEPGRHLDCGQAGIRCRHGRRGIEADERVVERFGLRREVDAEVLGHPVAHPEVRGEARCRSSGVGVRLHQHAQRHLVVGIVGEGGLGGMGRGERISHGGGGTCSDLVGARHRGRDRGSRSFDPAAVLVGEQRAAHQGQRRTGGRLGGGDASVGERPLRLLHSGAELGQVEPVRHEVVAGIGAHDPVHPERAAEP